MHVIVPTLDLVSMLGKLRPMRSLNTSGFEFAIYTLEAKDKKLRLIVGDRTSITASMEIFANVKQEGKASVNGQDFYESILKIVPEGKSSTVGSKEIILKRTDTQLKMETVTTYHKLNVNIAQKRAFHLVTMDLSLDELDKPKDHYVKIKAAHLAEIFKVSNRLISSYTSDIASLSGILLRVRNNKLLSVVSDGMRILEVIYPQPVQSDDFDVILPKLTANLLQLLIEEGDEVEIYVDSRRIKFFIDSDGLKTYLSSSILRAAFPEYEPIFNATGNTLSVNSGLFSDNISNIRKSLNDDTYRVKLIFDGTKLSMTNTKSSSHMEFSNDGLPVTNVKAMPFEIMINAFLLEGLLTLLKSEDITLVSPPDNKPLVILNRDEELKIRTAIALATE
jgi:DNA polymerase III sliding clamp (beta) subunit (PCNA family)